jgi:hypothetical protein
VVGVKNLTHTSQIKSEILCIDDNKRVGKLYYCNIITKIEATVQAIIELRSDEFIRDNAEITLACYPFDPTIEYYTDSDGYTKTYVSAYTTCKIVFLRGKSAKYLVKRVERGTEYVEWDMYINIIINSTGQNESINNNNSALGRIYQVFCKIFELSKVKIIENHVHQDHRISLNCLWK